MINSDEREELLPCPFCSGPLRYAATEDNERGEIVAEGVFCDECNLELWAWEEECSLDLIERANSRPERPKASVGEEWETWIEEHTFEAWFEHEGIAARPPCDAISVSDLRARLSEIGPCVLVGLIDYLKKHPANGWGGSDVTVWETIPAAYRQKLIAAAQAEREGG